MYILLYIFYTDIVSERVRIKIKSVQIIHNLQQLQLAHNLDALIFPDVQ